MSPKPLRTLRDLLPDTIFPSPADWVPWQHGLAAVVLIGALVVAFFLPADVANLAGWPVLNTQNAQFARVGLAGSGIVLALLVRGQPWWHTLACTLLALGHLGQATRYIYAGDSLAIGSDGLPIPPDGAAMPLTLLVLNLGVLAYFAILSFRPSVYEQLDDLKEEVEQLRRELGTERANVQGLHRVITRKDGELQRQTVRITTLETQLNRRVNH